MVSRLSLNRNHKTYRISSTQTGSPFHGESAILSDYAQQNPNKRSALLLDQNTLFQLEKDEELRKFVKNNNMHLIYPAGWHEGINVFSQKGLKETNKEMALEDLVVKTKATLQVSQSGSLDMAFMMRNKLKQLELDDRLQLIQIDRDMPNPETIANALAPSKITENQMVETLSRFNHIEHSEAAISLLKDHSHIFTPARLSQLHTELHQNIVSLVKQKGGEEKDIFYYIPQKGKSYGLTTMQYQMVNKIPSENILFDQAALARISNPTRGTKPTIVVLDDVAASGKSLYDLNSEFRGSPLFSVNDHHHLILAPLLATNSTKSYVDGELRKAAEQYKTVTNSELRDCSFLPAMTVQALKPSEHHQAFESPLTPMQRQIVKQTTDDNMQMWMNIVFPYMSPDNNNLWFAEHIAPHYTLNGAGIKRGQVNHHYEFPSV